MKIKKNVQSNFLVTLHIWLTIFKLIRALNYLCRAIICHKLPKKVQNSMNPVTKVSIKRHLTSLKFPCVPTDIQLRWAVCECINSLCGSHMRSINFSLDFTVIVCSNTLISVMSFRWASERRCFSNTPSIKRHYHCYYFIMQPSTRWCVAPVYKYIHSGEKDRPQRYATRRRRAWELRQLSPIDTGRSGFYLYGNKPFDSITTAVAIDSGSLIWLLLTHCVRLGSHYTQRLNWRRQLLSFS